MYYSVDRIEEDYAILEDENGYNKTVKLSDLPENLKESDLLKFENNIYFVDKERTTETKKNLQDRLNKLFDN